MTEYEEVKGASFWNPEPNESIEGVLTRVEEGQFGNNFILEVNKEEVALGSTVIRTKLKNVAIGSKVKVTYLGEVKGKNGRTYKDFKVEVAK